MSSMNKKAAVVRPRTHGGGPASRIRTNAEQQLRRTLMACLLWEDSFYESGVSIADRITQLCAELPAEVVSRLAIEARTQHKLRHAPLLLTSELAKKGGSITTDTVFQVVQRADELSELLSIYWRGGKTPISAALKRGLAKAFTKFDAYQLAKYNRDRDIKLRDVLFLTHAKPKDAEQAETWRKLVDGTLESPDTWEVSLSAGADKRETFTRLIQEGKLGYMALLRNLRNMEQAGVDRAVVSNALHTAKGRENVLPFRFVAAGRAAPAYIPDLDRVLSGIRRSLPYLPGHTVVMVDVSGSMGHPLSSKSDLTRMDAACSLASLLNCESLEIYSFSTSNVRIGEVYGIQGAHQIARSQVNGGTNLAGAVTFANTLQHDRIIVITDEQSTSYRPVPDPVATNAYMINVASYQNGVGYGKWTTITGFSENIMRWIHEHEAFNG